MWLLAKERQHAGETFKGVQVHRVPLPLIRPDDPLPREVVSQAINAAHQAATLAAGGTKTLLACRDGLARSCFVAALALMHGKVGAQEAIDRVRAARSSRRPWRTARRSARVPSCNGR